MQTKRATLTQTISRDVCDVNAGTVEEGKPIISTLPTSSPFLSTTFLDPSQTLTQGPYMLKVTTLDSSQTLADYVLKLTMQCKLTLFFQDMKSMLIISASLRSLLNKQKQNKKQAKTTFQRNFDICRHLLQHWDVM